MSGRAAPYHESAAGEEQPDTSFPVEPGKKRLGSQALSQEQVLISFILCTQNLFS